MIRDEGLHRRSVGRLCEGSALARLIRRSPRGLVIAALRAQSTRQPSGPSLSVPPGFVVERVAGPPLVDRPIVADFDDEGRLYVADSSGSNDKVDKQLEERPHRIVRLEDTDGDGRFDKSIVFADRMMFPEGTMWFDGSLYVAAPPSIWKLTDTNGDGVADEREEWFQGKTLTGCANDLHGPYLGPDGWIYWTKGAFAEQTYERPGKPPLVTRAVAHLPPQTRRSGDRHRDDRRHGQPGRCRVHPQRRADPHVDIRPAAAARPTRRTHPRDLRRRLRQGACGRRRPPADRRSDAGARRSSARRSRRA